MKAITPCFSEKGEFLSSFFLVTRPNGSKRFIFNLKKLNEFIDMPHFKIEDLRTASKLMTKDCFMSHIDLKNAYFLVPVDEKYRKFLRFSFEGILYEFNCLPFGLNISPYIFTKVMKPVASSLRSKGLISIVYLDDFFFIGRTFDACLENIQISITLLQSLGFLINYEKSNLNPSKIFEFLGFCLNSKTMTIGLPSQKQETLIKLINSFLRKKFCTIREFAQLIGSLVSSCPAVPYGMGYAKSLERAKYQALILANGNYDDRMFMSTTLYYDLNWWKENLPSTKSPIRQFTFQKEIFSDASTSGWGAFYKGEWQVPLQPCTWLKVSSTNNRPNLECPGEDIHLQKSTRCTTGRFPYSRTLSQGIHRLITDLSWTDPGEDAVPEPFLRTHSLPDQRALPWPAKEVKGTLAQTNPPWAQNLSCRTSIKGETTKWARRTVTPYLSSYRTLTVLHGRRETTMYQTVMYYLSPYRTVNRYPRETDAKKPQMY